MEIIEVERIFRVTEGNNKAEVIYNRLNNTISVFKIKCENLEFLRLAEKSVREIITQPPLTRT